MNKIKNFLKESLMSPLENLESIIRMRRAVRHFKSDPLDDEVLMRLLDLAHWAPSGYNLQPLHLVVVKDPQVKKRLRAACMDQPQIEEAPATVVFLGDRDVYPNNFQTIVRAELEAGAIDEKYAAMLRRLMPLVFSRGPLAFKWWTLGIGAPLLRFFMPVPSLPFIEKDYWLAKQVMLAAMNFMLAARAAGLGTCPMEGFDERRVRKALALPRSMHVVLVVPVGTPAEDKQKKTRLPLETILHQDRFRPMTPSKSIR